MCWRNKPRPFSIWIIQLINMIYLVYIYENMTTRKDNKCGSSHWFAHQEQIFLAKKQNGQKSKWQNSTRITTLHSRNNYKQPKYLHSWKYTKLASLDLPETQLSAFVDLKAHRILNHTQLQVHCKCKTWIIKCKH